MTARGTRPSGRPRRGGAWEELRLSRLARLGVLSDSVMSLCYQGLLLNLGLSGSSSVSGHTSDAAEMIAYTKCSKIPLPSQPPLQKGEVM